MEYVVYEIRNGEKIVYIGCTSNLVRRSMQHLGFTKNHLYRQWLSENPHVSIVAAQRFDNRADALKAEREAIAKYRPEGNVIHRESLAPVQDLEPNWENYWRVFGKPN